MFVRKRFIFRTVTVNHFQFGNEIFFEKVKENEELRGGVYGYAAQVTPLFNAEIHKKGRFRMETKYF